MVFKYLHKCMISGFVFGFAFFGSVQIPVFQDKASAQTSGYFGIQETATIWRRLHYNDRVIVDRLAADFYERSLRYTQSQAIENRTAQLYREAAPQTRATYREDRREQWRSMTQGQQAELRATKQPQFHHLSEQQKWPFRVHALHELGAAGAIQYGSHPSAYAPGI